MIWQYCSRAVWFYALEILAEIYLEYPLSFK